MLLLLLVSKVERFFFLLCIDKKGVVVGRRRMKADIFPAGEVTLFFPSSLSPDQICLFILSKKVQGSGGLEERGAVAVRYGCGTKGCFKESPFSSIPSAAASALIDPSLPTLLLPLSAGALGNELFWA